MSLARTLVATPSRRAYEAYLHATASARALPAFLIIGEAKCGTTSLYDDIVRHPDVLPAYKKEIHFFDFRFGKGLNWYRAHFPYTWRTHQHRGPRRVITGEASPYYLYHPHAPRRIKDALPQAKSIALLRNPVDRAYSHFQHEARKHRERRLFEEALAQEPQRLESERQRMLENEHYYSVDHRRRWYLARGIYVDQLTHWLRYFDRSQLLVIKSEDYFQSPEAVFETVLRFLELPTWKPQSFAKRNTGGYQQKLEPVLRRRLADYYGPHNRRLAEFLGVDFHWR